MTGIQEAFNNLGRLMAVPTDQLQAAFEQQAAEEEAKFNQLMEEAKQNQIRMFKEMKQKHSESRVIQELCDKELARLEKETTGAFKRPFFFILYFQESVRALLQ